MPNRTHPLDIGYLNRWRIGFTKISWLFNNQRIRGIWIKSFTTTSSLKSNLKFSFFNSSSSFLDDEKEVFNNKFNQLFRILCCRTMAPNVTSSPVTELPSENIQGPDSGKVGNQESYKWDLVWRNVILFAYLHAAALFGLYLMCFSASWYTVAWGKFK